MKSLFFCTAVAYLLHGFLGETSTLIAQVQVPESRMEAKGYPSPQKESPNSKVAMTRLAFALEEFRHNSMDGSFA